MNRSSSITYKWMDLGTAGGNPLEMGRNGSPALDIHLLNQFEPPKPRLPGDQACAINHEVTSFGR